MSLKKPNSNPTGKKRFHFGIRPKMILGLLVVFSLSIFILNWIITQMLTSSMESKIQNDMMQLRNNTEVYVQQVMMINGFNDFPNSTVYEDLAPQILENLQNTSDHLVAAYATDGTFLAGTHPATFTEADFPTEAFARAQEGQATYQLTYDMRESCRVEFIIPIRLYEEPLGYILYHVNYSNLQSENYALTQIILRITILVMAVTLLFSILLLTHFITPLRRLTNLTSRFKEQGLTSKELQTQKEDLSHALSSRHDEIGSLSRNYAEMLDVIRDQLQRISQDRNHIQELLNTKQTFFDNATHELKTPLTTIQGFAQLIQDNGTSDPELLETGINHILKESARLHQMVLELLEVSDKKLYYQLSPLDLIPLLTSVAEAMELKANRYQSHLRITCPESLVIRGQEDRLRQLLINLIDNAIKYGAPHEPIDITAGRRKKDETSPLATYLCVENGGAGMTPEQLAHIFEPFYRVDKDYSREQGSSGLGLAICQKIAQEHHAQIQVESTPGEKTRFTVWFKEESYDA